MRRAYRRYAPRQVTSASVQAPASWPATLRRGGVPRVMTRPRARRPRRVQARRCLVSVDICRVPSEINLDYAATAPCLKLAADAVAELLPWYGSVHRGAGALSQRCTLEYERARQVVGDFVGARPDDHVIFTKHTTEALNLLAHALPRGTTVITFASEHHANLLPWHHPVRLPVPASPGEAVRSVARALSVKFQTQVLVSVTGASNVTGEVWPIAELAAIAHRHGARLAVDAAQLAPHRPIDL